MITQGPLWERALEASIAGGIVAVALSFFNNKRARKQIEDSFYAQVGEEISRNEYKTGLLTKATAESKGNGELVKSLYIKYRFEQLMGEYQSEQNMFCKKFWVKKFDTLPVGTKVTIGLLIGASIVLVPIWILMNVRWPG